MRATDRLSLVFGALSDPTRRDIVTRLSHASTTVGELAGEYRISAPAVSQHLNVLERAGLVTRTTRAQWRTVALRTEPLDEAADWVERHRRDWSERLDALEDFLDTTKEHGDDHT